MCGTRGDSRPYLGIMWRGLVIVFAVLFVYAPALAGGWFWDDSALIAGDIDLRTLSGLVSIWSFDSDWPLTRTAFWFELHLWDRFPFGYHLTNIALHTANAFLVWKLLARLNLRWAWLGGLLFAVHPLAVESVAWASELKNTLSLLFFLLSLLALIDHDEEKVGYVRSLLFYTLALLAKTSVLMLPAVFLLHAWWKHGAITSRDLKKTIPFWLVAIVLGLVTMHFQTDAYYESADTRARTLVERCFQSGAAFDFYLGKFLWPSPLMPIYPRWWPASLSLSQLLALPLTVFLFIGLGMNCRRTWCRPLLLGLGFFALTLLPVLGFADMTYLKFSWVADHLVYLPMIGLVGLSVAGLESLSTKLFPTARILLIGAITIVTAALAWNAHTYAARFADEQKMWAYNIRLNPSAWAAHNNLGFVQLQSGRLSEARQEFDKALRLNSNSADVHNNLGVVLLQTGQYAPSITEFETALRLDPNDKSAQQNLQTARDKMSTGRNP